MRLTVYCARCLKGNRIVPPKPVVTCRACGNDMPLSGSETLERGRPVERCVLCGRKEFYVESDFPARIGCAVVVACIVAFLITENLWILIGAALVNFALMVVLPKRTICYQCLTEYHGTARDPAHAEYDLSKAARFADHPRRKKADR